MFVDNRYNRQQLVPQLGIAGQERLGAARVVSIGAGGVKSTLLYGLAAAGVGNVRIIDFDRVELSNLNRQILYQESDIGRLKSEAAAERLQALNSDIAVEAVDARVDAANMDGLLEGFDVVIEGGDSLQARQSCNQYCVDRGLPMVHASAQYGYGYVLTVTAGTACFMCAFPDLPASHGGSVPVIGTATALAGTLGAAEVLKLITGTGETFTDSYLLFSVFQGRFDRIPVSRDPRCATCSTSRHAARPSA